MIIPLESIAQGVDEIVFATRDGKRGVLSIQRSDLKDNMFNIDLNLKWVDAELKPITDNKSVLVLDKKQFTLSNPLVVCHTMRENLLQPLVLTTAGASLNFEVNERYVGDEIRIDLPFQFAENDILAKDKSTWEKFALSRPRVQQVVYRFALNQIVDKFPPEIRVTSPEGVNLGMKPIVDKESVKIALSVKDYFGVENVMVNNRPAQRINDSTYVADVTLKVGYENPITVLATDKSGLTNRTQFAIESRPVGSLSGSGQVATKTSTRREPSDVDIEIPDLGLDQPNRFALVIGNEDYTTYQPHLQSESNVAFAIHDAEMFKEYAMKILGVPETNIILLTNAKAIEMHNALDQVNLISKNLEGKAEFFVFYAGHGFPDEKTQEPYLIPVDVSGSNLSFAIKLSDFYAKITEHPTVKTTVFIDACFSGGGRDQGLLAARAVRIRPRGPQISGNLVVFSATTGDQSALPWEEKQHGMFTYHLLKKMKETQGTVSYEELAEYLRTTVGSRSVVVNNKEQNPQTNISPTLDDGWKNWTFTE
jgi:hypothetical protein